MIVILSAMYQRSRLIAHVAAGVLLGAVTAWFGVLQSGPSWTLAYYVAGFLTGSAAGAALQSVVWTIAGGCTVSVLIGLGTPRWTWITRGGMLIALSLLPVTVLATGVAARAPFHRAPHVARLVTSAAMVGGGVVLPLWVASPFAQAIWVGMATIGFGVLVPLAGSGHWAALAPSYRSDTGRLLDDACRAGLRLDATAVLALTEAVPAGAAVSDIDKLSSLRAWALCRTGEPGAAVRLLQAEVLAAGSGVETAGRRLQLAEALVAAWEAEDPAGLAVRTELPTLMAGTFPGRVPAAVAQPRAVSALLAGDPDKAYQLASVAVGLLPRGHKAWSLCTMAQAAEAMGQIATAIRLMDRARADDPNEPRLVWATSSR